VRVATARVVTEVAVGVLVRDGSVLLADRPPGKAYSGYWEFPGGKIEPGETVAAALARELREELALAIGSSVPWVTFEFDYPHAYVRLHFERVFDWSGSPHAREGQRFLFHRIGEPPPTPLLPAAVPALRWLALPDLFVTEAGGRIADVRMPARSVQVLTADELRVVSVRPEGAWVGARAEDRVDEERAAALGLDFALVGPVLGSPRRPGLGWKGLAERTRATPVPIFAYGGLTAADLALARRHGAHGVVVSAAAP